MNLDQFKTIIELLEETSNTVNKASKYVHASLFNKHNTLISALLETIYTPEAITYILYEWLTGNKSELRVKVDEDTTIIYPLNTVEDLYKAMELYKVN